MTTRITADSTCDLPPELIEKYGIVITPLYIIKDGRSCRDGLEISADDIFAHVAAGGDICSTAAVNIADYESVFGELLKSADAVVHFTISAGMSICYQNAVLAAESLGNVYVVDSANLSTGIGHLVLDACELARAGMPAADIKTRLDEKKKKLDVSFVLDTLEYLRRGGRCSGLLAGSAALLSIKPVIEVTNGAMHASRKYRGSFEKCMVRYIREKLSAPETIDPSRIFITDSGCPEDVWRLAESTVRECADFAEIIHTRAGCTISAHCGPSCLGILFYRK